MRLLICGGRDFLDVDYSIPKIHAIHKSTPISVLINGMAKGGDAIGRAWAKTQGIPIEEYWANWNKYGKRAGFIRNEEMLDKGQPDLVLGLPGGRGTAGMLKIARQAHVPVIEYRYAYFKKEDPYYGFLSNFHQHPQIDQNGIIYKSNEHYYHAHKTLNATEREWIIEAPTPSEAKKRGQRITVREDWDNYKLIVMLEGLRLKFNSALGTALVETADDYLVEYAPWGPNGDTFWGVNKQFKGENWLGRLLIVVRDELIVRDPNQRDHQPLDLDRPA